MQPEQERVGSSLERHGVECIPEGERTASPFDLFRIAFGGCNTFATAVLGSFPIIFGLSFQAGLVALVLGVLTGALLLAPMGLFGALNGTNNAVSSGAHFGVHGRIVGSFLSLLTAITFFSLSVWSSGDALNGAIQRLAGVGGGTASLACAYGGFALMVLVICIFGFRLLLLVSKVAVIGSTLLFLLGFPAFHSHFDPAFSGSIQQGQPGFWAAFVGAAFIAMSNPISFGAFLGDWSRYIPSQTSPLRIMTAVFFAQVASLLPFIFGLLTATIVATRAPSFITTNDYVGGLLAISPQWFFVPVCLIAFLGGLSTGGSALYGTGLDMSSLVPNLLGRIPATVLVGILASMLIFIGRFYFNLVQSVSTFATLIITCTTPWMVIMTIGLLKRRGWYDNHDLQAFSRGEHGGRYWYSHGWHVPALGCWVASAVMGLLFVNLPGQFVGWLRHLAGGIDLSLPVTVIVAACSYLLVLKIFPEKPEVLAPFGKVMGRHEKTKINNIPV